MSRAIFLGDDWNHVVDAFVKGDDGDCDSNDKYRLWVTCTYAIQEADSVNRNKKACVLIDKLGIHVSRSCIDTWKAVEAVALPSSTHETPPPFR